MPVDAIARGGSEEWAVYQRRYAAGEFRAVVWRDMLVAEAARMTGRSRPTLLDIGCGRGFDGAGYLQASLSAVAGSYVGIEPDSAIPVQPFFRTVHRSLLEAAPVPPGSVDLAFAVMVLEHVRDPDGFWRSVHAALREGGVFWGFTMDAAHWFVTCSQSAQRMRIKDAYLQLLHGRRGEGRYENYPTTYRSNSRSQLARLTRGFRERTILSFGRVGQLDAYFPKRLRWIGRSLDRRAARRGSPGSILAVRVVK